MDLQLMDSNASRHTRVSEAPTQDLNLFNLDVAQCSGGESGFPYDHVGALCREGRAISPQTRVEEAANFFQGDPDLHVIAIVNERHHPLGALYREAFMGNFLNRFGHDLFGRKPVTRLMDPNPLVMEENLTIESASELMVKQSGKRAKLDFLLTRNKQFLGVGHLLELLKVITFRQMQFARYANPLSGLPGNIPIQNEITRRIQEGIPFIAAYFDLDHFKPFNDFYGYEKGDQVIVGCARTLKEGVAPETDFVGHVGGDDFIILFGGEDWRERCNNILERFEALAPSFYDPEHRVQGGLVTQDRTGKTCRFSVVSLSVGAVVVNGYFKSHHIVAEVASQAKKMAKKIPGNSLFIERRHPSGPTSLLTD